MQVVPFTEKRQRGHHRQPLRHLTYVMLDEGNGGIVRDFNHAGVAVQAVAPLRVGQHVRVRFEVRQPKLRVEARGEVVWANSSGQSGIRFLDLPPKMIRQIKEWMFGNLLESVPERPLRAGNLFGAAGEIGTRAESDGLLISGAMRRTIRLNEKPAGTSLRNAGNGFLGNERSASEKADPFDLEWLSRPLSGKTLAWTIDGLVVFAAVLLFFLIFLSVSDELPEWPMNLAAGACAAALLGGCYWGFFRVMAGTTIGASLARLAESHPEKEEAETAPRIR